MHKCSWRRCVSDLARDLSSKQHVEQARISQCDPIRCVRMIGDSRLLAQLHQTHALRQALSAGTCAAQRLDEGVSTRTITEREHVEARLLIPIGFCASHRAFTFQPKICVAAAGKCLNPLSRSRALLVLACALWESSRSGLVLQLATRSLELARIKTCSSCIPTARPDKSLDRFATCVSSSWLG